MPMSVAERQARAEGLRVESQDFRRVLLAAKEFDNKLYAGLRRALRDASAPMVEDMRANIRAIPSAGKHKHGMREKLAGNVRAAIVTGGKSGKRAGIRITAKPAKRLDKRGKVIEFPGAAFNAKAGRFRHPIFADPERARHDGLGVEGRKLAGDTVDKTWQWVEQPGRPWFGAVVFKHQEQTRNAIAAALDEVARAMSQEVEGDGPIG